MICRAALCIALCALVFTGAWGETYYVSQDGSDEADGRTEATAWQTIARVNQAEIHPGDTIRLRRGDAWREQLVPHSGDENADVVYGAYGEGEKPLLMGSFEKNRPEDWRQVRDGIWVAGEPRPTDASVLPAGEASGWNLHKEGGAAAATGPEGSAHRIEVVTPGSGDSHIQFYTRAFEIAQGTLYRLTFRARSSEPLRFSAPRLMKSGPPWSPYANTPRLRTIATDADEREYEQFYRAEAGAEDARLTFFLGTALPADATLWIADPRLVACENSDAFDCDVGNVVFNVGAESFRTNDGGASCGVKVWEEADLDVPGEYWYDEERCLLDLCCPENPAAHYSDIECALRRHIIDETNRHNVVFEDLALAYGAAHGIGGANTHHITVRRCDIFFIGGGDQMGGDKTVRYGNGVEFWANAHDNLVEYCRLWEIYDAALTNQNNGQNVEQYNLIYRHNKIWNSEYSFEYWNRPENSKTWNVVFENNDCRDAGYGWGHAQRPDPSGRHLCFYTSPAPASDVRIEHNVFCEAKSNAFYAPTWPPEAIAALRLDDNAWWQPEGVMISLGQGSYTMADFAAYQTATGQDAHSRAERVEKIGE